MKNAVLLVALLGAVILGSSFINLVKIANNKPPVVILVPNDIGDHEFAASDFSVQCLDGTEYWMRGQGRQGYMAVKIDSKTRLPQACVDSKKVTK